MSNGKFDFSRNYVGDTAGAARSSQIVQKSFGQGITGENPGRYTLKEVPIEKITPRSINKYSQSRIDRLARSIRNTNNRLIHPIVLVKAADLPDSSPVIQKFRENGTDIDSLEYIIVAGERRYRAWMKLRAAEQQEIESKAAQGILGETNRFNSITANVLTRTEAKNEEAYYEDSNMESRQLTPLEALAHIKAAKEEAITTEMKREALIQMKVIEENSNADEKEIEKRFNQEAYIRWYLEAELGIEGWSSSNIKRYLAVINKCIPEVIEAVLEGKTLFSDARDMTVFDEPSQERLLSLLLEGKRDEFIKAINEKKRPRVDVRLTHSDAKKCVKSMQVKLTSECKRLQKINACLGPKDKEVGDQLVEEINALIKKLKTAEEKFK